MNVDDVNSRKRSVYSVVNVEYFAITMCMIEIRNKCMSRKESCKRFGVFERNNGERKTVEKKSFKQHHHH